MKRMRIFTGITHRWEKTRTAKAHLLWWIIGGQLIVLFAILTQRHKAPNLGREITAAMHMKQTMKQDKKKEKPSRSTTQWRKGLKSKRPQLLKSIRSSLRFLFGLGAPAVVIVR